MDSIYLELGIYIDINFANRKKSQLYQLHACVRISNIHVRRQQQGPRPLGAATSRKCATGRSRTAQQKLRAMAAAARPGWPTLAGTSSSNCVHMREWSLGPAMLRAASPGQQRKRGYVKVDDSTALTHQLSTPGSAGPGRRTRAQHRRTHAAHRSKRPCLARRNFSSTSRISFH